MGVGLGWDLGLRGHWHHSHCFLLVTQAGPLLWEGGVFYWGHQEDSSEEVSHILKDSVNQKKKGRCHN